jgi:tRNA A-37 threonylcarbamoyl transferase component Bud32
MEHYRGLKPLEKYIRYPQPKVRNDAEVRMSICHKIIVELGKFHCSYIYNNHLLTSNILVSYEKYIGAHVKFVDWCYFTDSKLEETTLMT